MRTIIIDPGHGGGDPGAVGFIQEASLLWSPDTKNLPMAVRVAHHIRACAKGAYDVEYTRTDEPRTVDLAARHQTALKLGGDLYLSLHANSCGNRTARGFEVWAHRDDHYGAQRLAELIVDEILASPHDRLSGMKFRRGVGRGGVKLAYRDPDKRKPERRVHNCIGGVIRSMPAVLVEMGFVTNPEDAALMRDRYWRDAMAKAIGRGVHRFFVEE